MYQQNRYQLERYHLWFRSQAHTFKKQFKAIVLYALPLYAICFVPVPMHQLRLCIILLMIYSYLFLKWDERQSYIQKISYTHRVKRLFFCTYVIYLSIFALLYFSLSINLLILCIPILLLTPYFMLYVSGAIMYPIEQKIRYSYVHEAKNLLNKNDQLVKIGITGSYGKTSVKHILFALLKEDSYAFMTPKSYNNLMGITLSIRKYLKSLHEVFIVEMGADHVGEIRELAQFVEPSIAIITAVGPQHIETFKTQENILREKMQLVEQLPPQGTAILNYDNEFIRGYRIMQQVQIITYGIHHEDVDFRAVDIRYSPKGSSFRVVSKDDSFEVETCLLGEHNVLNILAAISAAKFKKVKNETIIQAIYSLRYIEHRLEIRNMGRYTLLDDAYNSNPQGAAYALDVLAQMPGTKYLLTPGFLDLGDKKKQAHQEYAKAMISRADFIILIGETQTKDIYDTLVQEHFPSSHMKVVSSTKEAFQFLESIVHDKDTALIENDLPDAFNH